MCLDSFFFFGGGGRAWGCPFVQVGFVLKTILIFSLLDCPSSFVRDQWTVFVWVYFWNFCSFDGLVYCFSCIDNLLVGVMHMHAYIDHW